MTDINYTDNTLPNLFRLASIAKKTVAELLIETGCSEKAAARYASGYQGISKQGTVGYVIPNSTYKRALSFALQGQK